MFVILMSNLRSRVILMYETVVCCEAKQMRAVAGSA